ncbi:hypothetical protein [Kitasatospora sp. MAP5-34]|uniref:hypothetical protein n=1 Tax=Kitasatospora sp. MAP5-34 TaxID=3035102 RepID=UPI00247668D3|nr:hypothetical protein [Kitasatospora sp. MAP5-34]
MVRIPHSNGEELPVNPMLRSSRRQMRRSVRTVAVTVLAVLAASATTLPAQAAPQPTSASAAVQPSDGRSVTVHVGGKDVQVQLNPRAGIIPMRGQHTAPPAAPHQAGAATVFPPDWPTAGLQYRSGPVATAPKVYLDFWGSQWYANNPNENAVEGYLQALFTGLGSQNDTWSTVTSQYTDGHGNAPSFNGQVLAGAMVDTSNPVPVWAQQADIAAEAQNAAQRFGVSGPNVNIIVVSPSGTHPDFFPKHGFCAWHSWTGQVGYTNLPFVQDAGSMCGANSVQSPMDGFSIVAGHEYAETITDPQPTSGWVDPSREEIGDLCAWNHDSLVTLGPWNFAMQPLYSNRAGGCVLSSK